MNLRPDESELVGHWVFDGSASRGDATCERIEHLTANVLERIAFSEELGAWETLFRDPTDGRFWERTYPNGEMHGGGPPRLTTISEEEARTKYELETSGRAIADYNAAASASRNRSSSSGVPTVTRR